MKFPQNSKIKSIKDNASKKEIFGLLRNEEAGLVKKFEGIDLVAIPNLKLWREAYSSFGGKPKKNKPSVEALFRRVVKGEQLPEINFLVDLYNYSSIKYLVPAGADDLDRVEGKVSLGYAKGTESFVMLGTTEQANPEKGEVIYHDSKDVLCRRWNWRECEKTKITESTKNAVVYLESLNPEDDLASVLLELKTLVEKYSNAKAGIFLV